MKAIELYNYLSRLSKEELDTFDIGYYYGEESDKYVLEDVYKDKLDKFIVLV